MRSEIRRIVDEAKRAGKPIDAAIIWGLLSREVPEYSLRNWLSMMVRAEQIVRVEGDGAGKGSPGCFEPGPQPVRDGAAVERFSKSMGFMQAKRLREARAAARKWTLEPGQRERAA